MSWLSQQCPRLSAAHRQRAFEIRTGIPFDQATKLMVAMDAMNGAMLRGNEAMKRLAAAVRKLGSS